MHPRWLAGLCAAALVSSGCGDKKELASALIGAGVAAVAAIAYAAASSECWAQCTHGYRCDRGRGVCVPQLDRALTDPIVLTSLGDGCITEDDGSVVCPDDPATEHDPTRPSTPPTALGNDQCDDLCHSHERCRVLDGMAYCVTEDDPLYNDE